MAKHKTIQHHPKIKRNTTSRNHINSPVIISHLYQQNKTTWNRYSWQWTSIGNYSCFIFNLGQAISNGQKSRVKHLTKYPLSQWNKADTSYWGHWEHIVVGWLSVKLVSWKRGFCSTGFFWLMPPKTHALFFLFSCTIIWKLRLNIILITFIIDTVSCIYPVPALPESDFQRQEPDIPFRHKYLVPVLLNP